MSTSERVPSRFFLLLGCSVVFALYGGWCVGSHAFRMGGAFIVLALASAILGTLRWRPAPQPALDGDTVPMNMEILFAETIWIDPSRDRHRKRARAGAQVPTQYVGRRRRAQSLRQVLSWSEQLDDWAACSTQSKQLMDSSDVLMHGAPPGVQAA